VTIPLILLAIPSILVGFFTIGPMLFGHFFDGAIVIAPAHEAMAKLGEEFHEHGGALGMAWHGIWSWPFKSWPFLLALAGFGLATWFYLIDPGMPARIRAFTGGAIHVLEKKYWADDLWIKGFAGGGLGFGRLAAKLGDGAIIDGIFVDGSAWVVDRVASLARRVQSGYLYHYAFAIILGLIALLALLPKFGH
jgi:NADH-quinone oxidoreductase subunit L